MIDNLRGNIQMVLDTKTFEKGHVFYQGFSGKYNNKVLKSHQYFYVANKKSTANHYMYKNIMNTRRPPYVCTYELTRPLKLLNMNSKTITFLPITTGDLLINVLHDTCSNLLLASQIIISSWNVGLPG